jgi:putative transposase
MATRQKVYRFRMEPTAAQLPLLVRQAGARRWVWNWGLARLRASYQETKTSLSRQALSAALTALKQHPETAWLREIDSQLLQQSLRDLHRAFDNFFARRARYPRFKSRKRDQLRFRIPQRVRLEAGAVVIHKVGSIRIRQSQPVLETTKSATVLQEADGHWFVALTVEFAMPDTALPAPNPENVVGVDLGLIDAIVVSTGDRIPAPKLFRQAERLLRNAQRKVSQRKQRSRRRARAKLAVARVHREIAHHRTDFLHKLTSALVAQHAGICIEDLAVRGLARTKLAKSIADAAMGEFRRQLTYKADWHRIPVIAVDRWFSSSKRCSACGMINQALTRSERSWVCPACGTLHDQDLNAAINLRDEGLRLLAVGHTDSHNAQGDRVSPETAGAGR